MRALCIFVYHNNIELLDRLELIECEGGAKHFIVIASFFLILINPLLIVIISRTSGGKIIGISIKDTDSNLTHDCRLSFWIQMKIYRFLQKYHTKNRTILFNYIF